MPLPSPFILSLSLSLSPKINNLKFISRGLVNILKTERAASMT